ncbi:uncharacterized protein LOC111348347 [Spodoptera litura]|uniref:Uncharacterized protein LOC111348347 n=1 Tax=Spodoptera litura TaxID=69820 RepID=A0A9J7IKT3_SPOLT|nr:uncharacterized protein LOC111348347 [Spodoptera litura]
MKKNKRSTRTSNQLQPDIRDGSTSDVPIPTDRTISQDQFNENIFKFFIHSMIPLQAIDDHFFKKIFADLNISANGLYVPSRRTLGRLIDDYFNKEITKIKSELRNVDEVCTTADIWSAKTRSFLGVTAHWLDTNLKRKSETLACRRFSGTHSYDRIALLLDAVHAEFGLDSRKVLAAVTDNGSNFVKAFKEFGIDLENCENFTHNIDDNSEPAESSILEEDSHIDVISVAHFSTYNEVDSLAFDENIIPQSIILELPVHLRCCANKLNLCATTDANKVLQNNDTSIGNIHNQVIKKCNNLWNSASRPKSAEIILDIVGHTLSKPGITRWNSLYDSLKQIASIQEKSVQLHVALGMTNVLRDDDFHYIKEYLRCSKPIAEALDILQGEQDMYYGILLPCLVSLRKKLQKLNRESLTFCQMLVKKYLESVETRFAEFFDFSSKVAQNAAVAAMSYPRFKDKWLACVNIEYHSRIKSIFKGAVIKEIHEAPETLQVTPNNIYEDRYFEFDTDSSEPDSGDMNQIQRSKADAIISHFLADQDRDVSMLIRYPEIKRVFKKYNTPLPSSGPVERLFSYATMTNLPKSHRLSDEMFEKRVLLKSNLSHTWHT